jgi:hypothetical protein
VRLIIVIYSRNSNIIGYVVTYVFVLWVVITSFFLEGAVGFASAYNKMRPGHHSQPLCDSSPLPRFTCP